MDQPRSVGAPGAAQRVEMACERVHQRSIRVARPRVDGQKLSDHDPIVVDVRW